MAFNSTSHPSTDPPGMLGLDHHGYSNNLQLGAGDTSSVNSEINFYDFMDVANSTPSAEGSQTSVSVRGKPGTHVIPITDLLTRRNILRIFKD